MKTPAYIRGSYDMKNRKEIRIGIKLSKLDLLRLTQLKENKKMCVGKIFRDLLTAEYLKTFGNNVLKN